MTTILTGDLEDVLAEIRKLNGKIVRLDAKNMDPAYPIAPQMHQLWMARQFIPEIRCFIDPPKELEPEDLVPRPDRHVAFIDTSPSKAWEKWMKKYELTPRELRLSEAKMLALLTNGSEKLQIPKFTRAAAEHVLACNPGGRLPVQQAVWQCRLMEFEEPVSLQDVVGLWPYVPTIGKVYALDIGLLIRMLGTTKAVQMVSQAPEEEAFSVLKGLEKGCKKYPDRVELIKQLLKGITDKRWRPRAALVIFAHLCLSERMRPWESPATTAPFASPAIKRMYPLLNMSWLDPSNATVS